MRSTITLALAAPLVAVLTLDRAAAQQVVQQIASAEQAVQEQPLLDRPNRLGHFYGNTVRRAHHGRLCVNCGQSDRPMRRYFYLP